MGVRCVGVDQRSVNVLEVGPQPLRSPEIEGRPHGDPGDIEACVSRPWDERAAGLGHDGALDVRALGPQPL